MLKDKSSLTQKVLQGSFINMAAAVVTNVTRFLLVFMLARYYIKEEFGIWVTITSITAILATGDFGIGNALRNKLSAYIPQGTTGDKEAERHYLIVLYFFFTLTLVLSVGLYALQDILPLEELFKTDSLSLQSVGKKIVVWVQIILLIGIPFGISNACFYSYHESYIVAYLNIFQAVLSFAVLLLLVFTDQSIVVISLVNFTCILIMYISGTVIFVKRRGWSLFNISHIGSGPIVLEMLRKGFPFFILQISSAFLFNAGTVIISSSIGLSIATEYNLVQKLYLFILGVYQAAFNPMWAGYSHAINTQAWDWCKAALRNSLLVTLAIFSAATAGITFFGNFALSLLAGEEYVTQTSMFLLVGAWVTMYTLWACAQTFQSAMGKMNTLVITTLLAAISVTPFSKLMLGLLGIYGLLCVQVALYFILALIVIIEAYCLLTAKTKAMTVSS
ncbi:oligosaccharide flippase family protein [Pontibacter sp. BT731]|uniref:lipopolysaccharide biosynthesis protein n=1 Tax=Pontibacter coccineus TaxID=3063328 RepID=UPI0026E41209|nr:oligosaccharide flippase family protein [Pontibacter sp. BT731]MDO6391148.1 oligosaccharide flippase family protein [Pontibacter sp. BT731]